MNERKKLLVVTPRPPIRGVLGDTLRSRLLLEGLAEQYDLTIITLTPAALSAAERSDLMKIASELVVIRRGLPASVAGALGHVARGRAAQVGWLHSPALLRELRKRADSGRYMAAFVQLARFSGIEKVLGDLPLVVDFVDALSLQWERRASRGGLRGAFDRLEGARMREAERNLLSRAEVSIAAAPDDGRHLTRLLDEQLDLRVIRNGVDLPEAAVSDHRPLRTERPVIVFSGNLDYFPNAHALTWFASEVFPILKRHRPDLRFLAAGKVKSAEIQALAESHGVEFTGFVPDLNAVLADADLAVAPMQSGAGIQNKVLEAMAVGTPVVATRLGNAGIQAAHGREILIASSPERFAAQVEALLDDAMLHARISAGGLDLVNNRFHWRNAARRVAEALEEAAERDPSRIDLSRSVPGHRHGTGFAWSRHLAAQARRLTEGVFTILHRMLLLGISGMLFLSVLLLPFIAVSMWISSPGPLFYSQVRIGEDRRRKGEYRNRERREQNLGGQPFSIWKLRSMRVDSEQDTGPVWASEADPRITSIGHFLRKTRLDEFPQLWNVLSGEMSLIGPRPERPAFVQDLMREIPGYETRMSGTKPGVTGLAQVRGGYDTSIDSVREKLCFDLAYRAHTSSARDHFLMDLRVLLRTVPTVLFQKGAH